MCDSATLSTLEEVVRSKIQNSELFTAFDVTLAAQAALKSNGSFDSNEHRHRHLKNDIHTIVETYVSGGQYQRNLQNVGAATPAFVYYPAGGDPAAYVPVARNDSPATHADPYTISVPASAPVAAPAPVATTITVTPSGANTDGGRTVDARGSLTVPSSYLKAAGFGFNDTAYVYADGRSLVVTSQQPFVGTTYSTYTVDHGNNVRITKAVLESALAGVASFDFEAGPSNTVIVKAHS